ncbi:MAG: hypothetical protein L6R42_006732 [Xanthoria sp. 1 TBL-2021]|nr:MAG: hypothetical protein L6R42_006732 [Xanthoria sp. 1 TBL-2021]
MTLFLSTWALCVESVAGVTYSQLERRDPSQTCGTGSKVGNVDEDDCRIALGTMSQDTAVQTFNKPIETPADDYETVTIDYTDPNASHDIKDYLPEPPPLPKQFQNGLCVINVGIGDTFSSQFFKNRTAEDGNMTAPAIHPYSSTVSWQEIHNVTDQLIQTCGNDGGLVQFGPSLSPTVFDLFLEEFSYLLAVQEIASWRIGLWVLRREVPRSVRGELKEVHTSGLAVVKFLEKETLV